MATVEPSLRPHVGILRGIVGFCLFALVFFALNLALLQGEVALRWDRDVLLAFLGSAALGGVIYLAAAPIAARMTGNAIAGLYTRTLLRLWGAMLVGLFGLIAAIELGAYSSYLLGAGVGVLLLSLGVWPRAGLIPAAAPAADHAECGPAR